MVYKAKLKFSEAMLRFGLIPPNNIIADGKLHLCKYDKDGFSSEKGWYIFSKTKPETGLYGCFDVNKSRLWANAKTDSLEKNDKLNYLKRIYKYRSVLYKFKIDNGIIISSVLGAENNTDNNVKYIGKVVKYILKNCELKYSKPKCKYCDSEYCRYKIANDIFDKYGHKSFYRLETSQLGIAMGLGDPAKKYSKDNVELRDKYRKEINQIKSQFGRWKKPPKTKKSHTVTRSNTL